MMDDILRKAELFRNDCVIADTPRLEAEVLPRDVNVQKDLPYIDDGSEEHLLDVYYTPDHKKIGECFFLIHGGAFVYGFKELDKNFGMRLAKASELPVVNINYTVMPKSNMMQIIDEIDKAIDYVKTRFGFKGFHFVGDSAGGYLATLSGIRCKETISVSSICGCYRNDRNDFPGALFAREGEEIPEYLYDLTTKADRLKELKVALITGSKDFLRPDNIELSKLLDDCIFYDAEDCDGREMFHVFPIAHPEWPEGEKTLEIISSFVRKSC